MGGKREGKPERAERVARWMCGVPFPRRPVDEPRDGKALRYTRIECNKSGGESERELALFIKLYKWE